MLKGQTTAMHFIMCVCFLNSLHLFFRYYFDIQFRYEGKLILWTEKTPIINTHKINEKMRFQWKKHCYIQSQFISENTTKQHVLGQNIFSVFMLVKKGRVFVLYDLVFANNM